GLGRAEDGAKGDEGKSAKASLLVKDYDDVKDETAIQTKSYDITKIGKIKVYSHQKGEKPAVPLTIMIVIHRTGSPLEIPHPETAPDIYLRYGDTRKIIKPEVLYSDTEDGVVDQALDFFPTPRQVADMSKPGEIRLEIEDVRSSVKGEAIDAIREMVTEWPLPLPPDPTADDSQK
nr:hypothetical protein [Armatimonadota bacterium]